VVRWFLDAVPGSVAAASRSKGTACLRVAEGRHAGHNTLGSFVYQTAQIREERIPTVPLDTVVEEHGISRVHVMKVDVEGAEYAALEGARASSLGIIPHCLWRYLMQPFAIKEAARRPSSTRFAHGAMIFMPSTARPAVWVLADRPDERDPNVVAMSPRRASRGGDEGTRP